MINFLKLNRTKRHAYLYNSYHDITLADLTYDLIRKNLDAGKDRSAEGYAYEYREDNTLLKGKDAKLLRAVLSISLGDIYKIIKKLDTPEELITNVFGKLEIGDVIAPYVEKRVFML